MLSLGVILNVPISELLQALQQFQQKSGEPVDAPPPKAVAPEPKAAAVAHLAPAMAPGLVAAPVPPAAKPAAEAPPTATPAAAVSTPAWPPASNITWESEIADLQPHREDYAAKCRWEPIQASQKWILPDEGSLIQNLNIKRLKWEPLGHKAPTPLVADLTIVKAKADEAMAKAEADCPPSSLPSAGPTATGTPLQGEGAGDADAADSAGPPGLSRPTEGLSDRERAEQMTQKGPDGKECKQS